MKDTTTNKTKPKTFSADAQKVFAARNEPLETPIDLCVADAVPLLLPDLEWMYLNRVPSKLKIANTGRTMIMNPQWSSGGPRVRGGPLKSEYVLAQIHFHWGRSDDEGSEHSVEGHRLPLEMHVVSYSALYDSHHRALQERDGTLVVAFFFVLQDQENPDLSELMPALERVSDEGTTIRFPPFALSRLVPAVRSDYLIYWGTVSSRDLVHQLLWLVDRKPIGISQQQMTTFRAIHQGQEVVRMTDSAPEPRPGAVFYADPTRRPLNAPTLLPLDSRTLPSRESVWARLSPKGTPRQSPKGSLLSNRLTKSTETGAEKPPSQQDDYEIYKAMNWDQEKPFGDPTTVPVGFSLGCARPKRSGPVDTTPYLPARKVSFNRRNQPPSDKGVKPKLKQKFHQTTRRQFSSSPVQYPNRREAVETGRTGYTSSDSSESESARTRYYTARSSMRRRSPQPGTRMREKSASRAPSQSIESVSSSLSARHPGNRAQKGNIISVSQPLGEGVSVPWSDESLSPSIELASSDLSDPAGRRMSRTRPSIINTCGIEDIIIERLPPTASPTPTPSRVTRRHPEAAAIISNQTRGANALPHVLLKDHPNVQPMLAKSMTGASVAGSFVQEEMTRRDQEGAMGSKGV